MKKTLSIFLASLMTLAALTGCSSAPKEAATTAAETTTAAPTTVAETTTAAPTTAVVSTEAPGSSDTVLRVGSMKGPTSMGLVSLMDQAAKGEAKGKYEFTMVTAADELVAKVVSGDLDIALVPANMASILYSKTNYGVNVIDINTLGVLYVVSGDASLKSIADLKGKTIYMTGKGTTPDYVINYLLSANGLSAEDVTLEYKSEATEVAAVLKEQPDAIGLLPQPFATVAMAQNDKLQISLDLTAEWEKVQGGTGGSLVTGVTICRSELLGDPITQEAVDIFMAEHKASAAFAIDHVEETAQLVAAAGIIEKAPIAAKALPYCSISYVDGSMMKSMLDGYLTVLFEQNPASIGGKLPDDAFYYIP
ncbi:MAG: ABC transporter substrate-binding protein [Hungatella sp.]